jgi:hypothetical protein
MHISEVMPLPGSDFYTPRRENFSALATGDCMLWLSCWALECFHIASRNENAEVGFLQDE